MSSGVHCARLRNHLMQLRAAHKHYLSLFSACAVLSRKPFAWTTLSYGNTTACPRHAQHSSLLYAVCVPELDFTT